MTAVDDSPLMAVPMAVPDGSANPDPNAQTCTRARARLPVTERVRQMVATARSGVSQAWVWTDTPPSLARVSAGASAPTVPGDHRELRWLAVAWNHTVAVPFTALGYLMAWLAQHPARGIPAAVIVAILATIWI